MIEAMKKLIKKVTRKSRVKAALSSPEGRLEMMKAGYKKFSPDLTERERKAMKKEIKQLERNIKRHNRRV